MKRSSAKPIGGLYDRDAGDYEFYLLLARVLSSRFSKSERIKGDAENEG